MSELTEFADKAVEDIEDIEKRKNERYRIIGMLEEKKRLYTENGLTEANAEKMAISDFEALGKNAFNNASDDSQDKTESILLSDRIFVFNRIILYISIALTAFFAVMLIISLFRIKSGGILNTVTFLCNALIASMPILISSVYKKATKNVQRMSMIILEAFLVLASVYSMIINITA